MLKTKAQNTGKDESDNKRRRDVAQILCECGNLSMTKKEKWKKKTFTNYFRQGFLLVEDNVMSKITFAKRWKIIFV